MSNTVFSLPKTNSAQVTSQAKTG